MTPASERVLVALASLESDPDFVVLMEWMRSRREEETKTLMLSKDHVQVRWSQGACQFLDDFIELAEKARAILHKRR